MKATTKKLTDEERQEAKKKFEERIVDAIDECPRGLKDSEIRECMRNACSQTGIKTGGHSDSSRMGKPLHA